jgi:hypothetical protein
MSILSGIGQQPPIFESTITGTGIYTIPISSYTLNTPSTTTPNVVNVILSTNINKTVPAGDYLIYYTLDVNQNDNTRIITSYLGFQVQIKDIGAGSNRQQIDFYSGGSNMGAPQDLGSTSIVGDFFTTQAFYTFAGNERVVNKLGVELSFTQTSGEPFIINAGYLYLQPVVLVPL